MIGLIVLLLAGVWVLASLKFARFLASRFKHPLASALVGVIGFLAFAVLPFLDELVGRWQFARLCASEAVVWVSPNASTVVAAKNVGGFSERTGLLFPVRQQSIRYADTSNGEVFYTVTAFHTPGGLLMQAGLGLGNSTSCWPERWSSKEVGIDIDTLLKRGKQ